MDLKKLIETLHPLERKVVPVLGRYKELSEIMKATGLQEVEVTRALQWLENKGVIKTSSDQKDIVVLGENGRLYSQKGLPEKRLLITAKDSKRVSLNDLAKAAALDSSEAGAAVGALKQKFAITVSDGSVISLTEKGKKILFEQWPEEKLLKRLSDHAVELKDLDAGEKAALDILKRRRDIISIEQKKTKNIELTVLGKELSKQKISSAGIVDKITPQTIIEGAWKGKTFRRYDVKINVPEIHTGRKQHYRRFLDEIRQKFVGMGFKEMSGPVVETEFWNMDALFMPQFHSARDIHDAYYIKDPKYGKLDEKIVAKVAEQHESGWKYQFDAKRTHRQILRTQGTACSVRMLASKDLQIPGKYFGITRCFRHDVIDATHLPDFHQTEGIIVEEGLNMRHLFGLLKMFAKEFTGADEIKIVPGYFPFTEPSCELYAKHPQLGWIELGGAGIFRPEVVKPLLGKNVSVLAWGLGIDRIAMFKLGIDDIRELFSHNLQFLRNARVV
jgi:phenylalanyl-tRNA synthetase alpha chain